MSAPALLEEAIAAHGGPEAWSHRDEVVVRVSSGGFAFASKLRRPLRDVEGRVATTGQRTVFDPFPEPSRRGVFEGGDVRIEDADGRVLAERRDARRAFRSPRRLLWWDALDFLYFGGYALWGYLSMPFVLARPGYRLAELDPWEEAGETWRRLEVTFPDGVHAHSQRQVLYLDDQGRIRRNDYVAEPFGRWARAAHYAHDHRWEDGLLIPTRRRVYPRRPGNRPLPRPTLVWIDLSSPRRSR